jgi:hypothetical protein
MNRDAECRLSLDDTKRAAGELNEFVTAFDQIFSRILFKDAGPDLFLRYFIDRDVMQRLGWVRGVIFDALEAEIGQEAADQLGDEVYNYFTRDSGASDG